MSSRRTFIRRIASIGLLLAAACGVSSSQSFTKITTGSPVTETGAWRSVNWIDYDRDGDLDLFVTRGLQGGQDNVLFRNEGGPSFTFTRMSGLPLSQDDSPSDGATWADYDNDGYLDAFVANWYGVNNLLYHNDRNGAFTQVTTGAPVTNGGYSETASWGDYNNDGLADLYVANSGGPRLNFLYKNTGNGQFTKITSGRQSTDAGTSRGVNWVDYDDDGDLDLFVTNESNESEFLYRNMLLESGVDTFQRVSSGPLVTSGGSSWSGSWADYDNDGDLDVFTVNNSGQASRLFVNGGGGAFTPDSAEPIATDQGFGASAGWGDLDNDGDLDLIVTHAYSALATVNYLYRNMLAETDTARFERVTAGPVVTDAGFMYGTSWGDYDGDGDLDLFVARTLGENQVNALYRNNGNANHWLMLDLRGTASNAAALGARVRVRAVMNGTPVWQMRVVEGQSGYCGQNLQIHFGLSDAAAADSLVVEWPSGNEEIFTGVAADAHLVIVELDSTPVTLVSPPEGFLNGSPDVLLRWNRSLHYPPYRLQVSTDSTFAGGMVADTMVGTDTSAVVRVLSNMVRYYWRVRPARSIHESMWSAARSFDNDVQAPGAAPPLSPAGGAVNVPVSAQLRWGTAPLATAYRVRLSGDSLFTLLAADTTVSDTVFTTGTLSFLTTYYWDVRSENLAGPGPVTAHRGFTTVIAAPTVPVLSSPPPGEINVAVPAPLTWFAADRAAAYQVQVVGDSQTFNPMVADTLVDDTALAVDGLQPFTAYFWRVRSTNAGGQSVFTGFRPFRTSVARPALLQPPDDAQEFSDVTFVWGATPPAAGYHLQYGSDSAFTVVGYEDSTLADTTFSASGLQTETEYFWRVRGLHPTGAGPWSAVFSFFTSLDTFLFLSGPAWNLVSLPGNLTDRSATAVFPGALTPFYAYPGAYAESETLEHGRGYWVRMAAGTSIPITGTKRLADTIDVQAGWNLVGSVSEPVPVGAIGTIPGGLASSQLFGYDGSYRTEDTLRPGAGYWIRMHQGGKLVLRAASLPAAAGRLRVIAESDSPPPAPGDAIRPGPPLPDRAGLSRNFPNPFNPSTEIRFQIPEGGEVRIEVFDPLGSRIAVLADGYREAGYHSVSWNAADRPSGVYFVRMTAGPFTVVRNMLLMK